MKGNLAEDVGPDDTVIHVEYRFRIDDEHLHFVRRTNFVEGDPPSDPSRWIVLRGQDGTSAASHLAGAELVLLPEES